MRFAIIEGDVTLRDSEGNEIATTSDIDNDSHVTLEVLDRKGNQLLRGILKELRILNRHLALVTNTEIREFEVNGKP